MGAVAFPPCTRRSTVVSDVLVCKKSESRAVRLYAFFHWLLKYGEWRARWLARRDVKNRMKRQQLIPDYQVGCNRILLANDWYSSV